MKTKNEVIAEIAVKTLGLETLETRKSDSLDFSDQAVWTLKAALEAAYAAGLAAGKSGLSEVQKKIRDHLVCVNPDGVSITDCFVGMVETGEATVEDIRVAIGEDWAADVKGELARFAAMERETQE